MCRPHHPYKRRDHATWNKLHTDRANRLHDSRHHPKIPIISLLSPPTSLPKQDASEDSQLGRSVYSPYCCKLREVNASCEVCLGLSKNLMMLSAPTIVAGQIRQPAAAQFGVAGGKKKGSSFQELNEQAKKMQDDGGMGDLSKLMGDIDPKMLEEMVGLGGQLDEVMKMMASMSPEELEKQMKDAMEMLQSGDMMQNMLKHQEDILKTLEETGQIAPDELAKFKTDPEYFEQKMKESFEQMGALFSDPEMLKLATESMAGLGELYKDPSKMNDMMAEMMKDFGSDEKIEEVRQMFLESGDDLGAFGEMFNTPEMKEILSDPKKWRDTVKEGQQVFQGVGAGQGAGIDEL